MTDKLYTQSEVDELLKAAEAAALREVAKKFQKQAEEYGYEHGQVDPTTGVWEATELEMQYCETLETVTEDIESLIPEPSALARHDAESLDVERERRVKTLDEYPSSLSDTHTLVVSQFADRVAEKLKAEFAAAMEKAVQIAYRAAIPGHLVQAPSCMAIAERIRALIPGDHAAALAERVQQAVLTEAEWWEHLAPDCGMLPSGNPECIYCQRLAVHRAARQAPEERAKPRGDRDRNEGIATK